MMAGGYPGTPATPAVNTVCATLSNSPSCQITNLDFIYDLLRKWSDSFWTEDIEYIEDRRCYRIADMQDTRIVRWA